MLPKKYRLKNNIAFTTTYKLKNIVSDKYFILYLGSPIKEESQTLKIGFVVSKKFHKRAVKRNRIKRLMRESYRLLIKDGCVSDKYISLIFVASGKLLGKNFNEVDNTMRKLVYKL